MARMLAVAALALAALWPPRSLVAVETAARAHVPFSARRSRYLMGMGHQQLRCRSRSKQTNRSSSSPGGAGAVLRGSEMAATAEAGSGDGLRSEFRQVLLSRRRDLQGQPSPLLTSSTARAAAREIHLELLSVKSQSRQFSSMVLVNSCQIEIK
jgi:hypothetical protein